MRKITPIEGDVPRAAAIAIIGIRQRQRQAVIVGFVGLCIIAHIADPGHGGSALLGGGCLRLVDFAVGTDLILLPASPEPMNYAPNRSQTPSQPARPQLRPSRAGRPLAVPSSVVILSGSPPAQTPASRPDPCLKLSTATPTGSPFSFLRTSAQTCQSPAPALQTAVNPRQAPVPKWRREDQTTTCTVQLALRLPWRSGMPARQGHIPPPVPLHCRCDRPALRAPV